MKFEKTQYKFQAEQVLEWTKVYGEPLSDVQEETEKLVLDNSEETDDDDISVIDEDFKNNLPDTKGTGTYKVKVRLEKFPPQYLPMYGQKVRIHFQGIKKICTQCYQEGHIKRDCKGHKRQWISYVRDFVEDNAQIPMQLYGRWAKVLEKEFGLPQTYQTIHPTSRHEMLHDITKTLHDIRMSEQASNNQITDMDETDQSQTDTITSTPIDKRSPEKTKSMMSTINEEAAEQQHATTQPPTTIPCTTTTTTTTATTTTTTCFATETSKNLRPRRKGSI